MKKKDYENALIRSVRNDCHKWLCKLEGIRYV